MDARQPVPYPVTLTPPSGRPERRADARGRAAGPNGGSLAGLKVVEFDQVIAGPLAGAMLADQGADVVHVEPPGAGDPARAIGPTKEGVHLWWKVSGRNKRWVTIDLRRPAGRELANHLVRWAEIAIVSLLNS